MVAILLTPEIRQVLKSANLEDKILKTKTVETISHTHLASALRQTTESPSLATLLQSAELHLTHAAAVTKHVPPARNPHLEARVSGLRARLLDEQYARIVRAVSRVEAANAEVEAARMSKLAPQMALGFNVIITMATCFVAGYFVFKASSGSEAIGLIGGTIGMIIAMCVEVVLVLTRMYSIDAAVDKHVKRRQQAAEKSAGCNRAAVL